VKVEFAHADGSRRQVEVPPGGLTIGRTTAQADLGLDWDKKVSRRHGRLYILNGKLYYEDLGSSNGSWMDGSRLGSPVELLAGRTIILGDTRLTLQEEPVSPDSGTTATPDGMTLRLRGKVEGGGLADVMGGSNSLGGYMVELAKMVNELMSATDRSVIAKTLKGLYKIIPAAHRIYCIAWPPEENGLYRHLIPPQDLAANEAMEQIGGVSNSLASLAVKRREALLFTEGEAPNLDVRYSAILRGIRSAVYVPLINSQQEVLGVFCVDCPLPSIPFDEDSFQFLRAIGGLLATSLEAERLREEARQREMETRAAEAHRESLANFLKIASHDLKNPLTVVRACAQLIEHVEDLKTVRDLSSRILDAELRAEALIKAYLEVSELQSSKAMKLELTQVDLRQAVDEEFRFIKTAFQSRAQKLIFENRVTCVTVLADQQKLRQILNNLIGNAAKYTPKEGIVSVDAEVKDKETIIKVSDQGVGISPEDQAKLFKEFERVGDKSVAPGTGLGLWLTAALIKAHGGRIWVESEPNVGSTFFVAFPCEETGKL
jgi:signal transduction histidine kinase